MAFLLSVQGHFKAAGNYLLQKDDLSSNNPKSFCCLNVDNQSEKTKTKLATKLAIDVKIEDLIVKWKILKKKRKLEKELISFGGSCEQKISNWRT